MNFAHLHIVLNHVPSLGTVVGVALFIASLIKNSDHLKRISLYVLVGTALATLPTYMSGNAAQQLLRRNPAIPQGLIEEHQNSAMITLVFMTITGTFAWFGLWQFSTVFTPRAMEHISRPDSFDPDGVRHTQNGVPRWRHQSPGNSSRSRGERYTGHWMEVAC